MVIENNNQIKSKSQIKKYQSEDVEKINSNTPYDFSGKMMTPYGGLLPLAGLMEKTEFERLCETNLIISRETESMGIAKFIESLIIALYIGFDRLNHIKYISKDPMILRLLGVSKLPWQSTYWRFLKSLGIENVEKFKFINTEMMNRIWQITNIQLKQIIIDTDTTVNTVYGRQEESTVSYNPKNRGKRSYQPILSFISETGEYITGENRSGDKMSGKAIAKHLDEVFSKIPSEVESVRCRADAGFYCKEAIEKYEEKGAEFIVVAQKTPKLANLLEFGDIKWKSKKRTGGVARFKYQPQGWKKEYRFLAVRYPKEEKEEEQYQLFEGKKYKYRVFVTNMKGGTWQLIRFYDGRAGAENLIKEANNDAGLASIPSKYFDYNNNFFQLVMLAYNFNRWLIMMSIKKGEAYKRTQLATTRLMMLFIAAKIVKHSNRLRICYSEHYEAKDKFNRLMERIIRIRKEGEEYFPVIKKPITEFY